MAAHPRRTITPLEMAEQVLDLLDKIPGARTVFLERTRTESIRLHTAKVNDPEPERWRKSRGFSEVGTYKRGVLLGDVADDIRETLGRA